MTEEKAQLRIPPNSKESEMMVLGCMLTSVNALNIAADLLDEADFYYSEHKIIFSILKEAYSRDLPIDVHLLCEELKRRELLKAAGGVPYATALAQYAGTSAYIEEYGKIVRNKSILRRMIDAAQLVEKRALEDPPDVHEALDEAQNLFFIINQGVNRHAGVHIREIFSGVRADSGLPYLKELEERQERYRERGEEDLGISGMPTHLHDLDRLIDGFHDSNLMILAGRPAMGKTALALNLAENICFKNRVAVGVFSLEMSAEQLVHRMVCSQAEVESDKIRTGSLNGIEYQKIVAAVHSMQGADMIIDDQPGLKITDLRARARRMKENYDIGFLMVDYLQLLSGSGTNRSMESRQIEISEISRMLKNLARELDVPILCLSQLSRKVEERAGHRPMMSDLRESGSIEQDSDLVMFILRREYYDANDKPGTAELIIGKNRHGATGSVNLAFRKEMGRFDNLTFKQEEFGLSPETQAAFDHFSP